jgi:acyl-CoA synthetase (AMP-forming)/AMP-acid ligase II
MGGPLAAAGTIPGVVERAATAYAGHPALIGQSGIVTFDELLELVRSAARALIDAGVGSGDRVAIWGPNTPEWAMASLAVLFAGGSVVPVNMRYTAVEAAALVSRARCRVVLAEGEWGGRSLAQEAAAMPGPDTVVSLGERAPSGLASWAEFARADSSSVELDRRMSALSPGDVSHVQYTSGTTGVPKGAMLCHGAMVETTARWADVVGLTVGDCYPVVSPFSHIGGHKTGLLACLVAGATTVPVASFDAAQFERTVAEHEVTVVQGPPTLFHALIERAREGSDAFGTLRVGVTGAAVIPPTLVRDMLGVLGLGLVVTAYGLTETTGVCTMTRPGDPIEVVAETSGRPIEGVDVRIVDESGATVAPGSRGEIAVRGIGVMRGYLDDPDATDATMHGEWLATGDVGWIGEGGNLHIVDRLKDMVMVGGFNVYPAEVERVLLEHDAVAQAAVIGLADARMGEVPAAFVVLMPGAVIDVESLVVYLGQRLAKFKVPRTVWLVDALPMNAAGKVAKAELRSDAVARLDTSHRAPFTDS